MSLQAATRLKRTAPPRDPVIARALNDPLMSDPDLARRSEANAVLGFTDSTALPVFAATSDAKLQAREAARRELPGGGAVAALPPLAAGAGAQSLGGLTGIDALLAASGAPAGCAKVVREGFDWAAKLPDPARIMPHGMAMQAAGAETQACRLRLVRYHTAAGIEDALIYHHTLALRAGMEAALYDRPEAMLQASDEAGRMLRVQARADPSGMNEIDVIYWAR
ncbi:MAG: hypothetical protein ACXIT4_11955 [Erythrobacter sp.]